MGGLGFLTALLALTVVLIDLELQPAYLGLVCLVLAFGLIGLADDLLKVYRQKNLGLTFWQKLALQIAAAALFAIYLTFLGANLSVTGQLKRFDCADPYLYQLLVILMVVGSANATNLTDGLNGLLAGTAGLAFLALAVIAAGLNAAPAQTFALVAAGAVIAFLYFNFPRARIFMGDVGSLALGAALAGLAAILHQELRLLVIGGVFVIECLSVIVQVAFYKLFRRRLLPMTPLHHSFELMGIKEPVVVTGFWVAGAVLGLIAIWI